jgi:predicted RNA-binding protein Jag
MIDGEARMPEEHYVGGSASGSGGAPAYDEDDDDSQIRDLGRIELNDPPESAEEQSEEDDAQLPVAHGAALGVEILTRLLELMGLDGDVILERTESSAILNIEGDDLGVLIGRRGLTLSALQYIVRLIIASRESEWPTVSVDVCGYKRRRHVALEELARKLADQAKYRHRSVTLEPMPPDERRVVHLALANHPDVDTESIGEDPERKVVIHPKRA